MLGSLRHALTIAGTLAWMAMNHCGENCTVVLLHDPKGIFTAKLTALTNATFDASAGGTSICSLARSSGLLNMQNVLKCSVCLHPLERSQNTASQRPRL